ncbi:MAG: aldehyde dehydrogenase family protein [Chloroflexi bacterium]|nr:MAG: aldehyde dehydrogenase family protein [Chloroflexota bacterium]
MITLPEKYIPLNPDVENFLAQTHKLYIGGEWLPAQSGKTFPTIDPSTGRELTQVASAESADVDVAVTAARRAFDEGPWRNRMTAAERSKLIWRLADLIEAHGEILAQLDSLDNGKPLNTTRTDDVPLSVDHFRYYAGWPTKIEGATIPVNTPGMFNYTVREPVGVCGLIVPWNYPLLMAAWKIAPALAAGNCIILKPAEQTPLSALYLAQLFEEAGFPPGVFNVLTGFGHTTGAALTEHLRVDKIGFTGSVETAKHIIKASVSNLKRVTLELGGKSPNIIFADADIENAIVGATWAIFGNNGQSCTAGSRLYIERPIYERVLQGMADEARKIKVGPGMYTEQPDIGPVISREQLDKVLGYVDEGYAVGGQTVTGGKRMGGEYTEGYFIEPTIFTQVDDGARIAREEIFGPVVCAMPFDDPDEIVKRANATEYGLAAGVWTRDLARAHRMAAALQAGTVWINTWGDTDAASPFGGYKQSGHGREMGKEALDLYTEVKSVWINTDG